MGGREGGKEEEERDTCKEVAKERREVGGEGTSQSHSVIHGIHVQ